VIKIPECSGEICDIVSVCLTEAIVDHYQDIVEAPESSVPNDRRVTVLGFLRRRRDAPILLATSASASRFGPIRRVFMRREKNLCDRVFFCVNSRN
jgi:hypothetical protein